MTVLTPLLTDWLADVQVRFEAQYGQHGATAIATTVIRAVKAWVKWGLDEQLQTADSHGSDSTTATKLPGYIVEILVVYVFEQRLQQGSLYAHSPVGELRLFMDVLQEASQLLRPAAPDSKQPAKPIAVFHLFTFDDLVLFRGCWGLQSCYTPYIIHPADPSYNCTLHTDFEQWEVLADAAGELHEQMEQIILQQQADGDAWEFVMERTTLGLAVEACRQAIEKQPAGPGTLQ
jgi:hypothetical protein